MRKISLKEALNTPNIKFRAIKKQAQYIFDRSSSWTRYRLPVIGFIMRDINDPIPMYYMDRELFINSENEEVEIKEYKKNIFQKLLKENNLHHWKSDNEGNIFTRIDGEILHRLDSEQKIIKHLEKFDKEHEIKEGYDTEHLLSNPNNKKRLLESVEQLEEEKPEYVEKFSHLLNKIDEFYSIFNIDKDNAEILIKKENSEEIIKVKNIKFGITFNGGNPVFILNV